MPVAIGFKVEGAKNLFFDRATVRGQMDRKTRRALSKFGAFVRTRAKTSIRKRKGVSEPGQPPSSHVGLYRKLIFFAYDPARKSVVIGPVLLNGKDTAGTPERLEKGGTLTVRGRDGRIRILRYRPRPAMRLAFDAELPGAANLWAN